MAWKLLSNVVGLYVNDTHDGASAAFYRALATLRRGGCYPEALLELLDGRQADRLAAVRRVAQRREVDGGRSTRRHARR